MKIYTGFGDEGNTSLFGGHTVKKNNPRVDAYGTLDELNSYIGLLRTKNTDKAVNKILTDIQNEIFIISSEIATPDENRIKKIKDKINYDSIKAKEKIIDELSKDLDPLKNFILPGGSEAGAITHVVRTICRRTERTLIPLFSENLIRQELIVYLNRLSDLFFILARYFNKQSDTPDVIWKI